MKKNSTIVIAIVAVAVVAGVGFALMHKSTRPAAASSTAASTQPNAPAANTAVLTTKTSSSLGQYFVTAEGKPLYTYGGDSAGVSNCTGSCLASWPAYQDTGSTTGLPAGISTIKRTDNGETQYAYNGMPLYTFVGDSNGQPTGNGVDRFSVAKPASASTTTSAAPSAPASSSDSSADNW